MNKRDKNNSLPDETRDILIKCMNDKRMPIKQKQVGISKIEIPPDRSLVHRSAPTPVRTRSAQLSSLSYGSLFPKI